jgi:uncharacterized membrane-anchored protein
MNPLIQAVPEQRSRDAKPQSLKYLLAVALIVGLFSAAAVVTGFIPAAAHALLAAPQAAVAASGVIARNREGSSCVG